MQATFKLFIPFLLCLAMLFVSGCMNKGTSSGGDSDPVFVGTWTGEGAEMELLKDGTAIFLNHTYTWKVEDGRLVLTGTGYNNSTYILGYDSSDSTFALYTPTTGNVKLQRK